MPGRRFRLNFPDEQVVGAVLAASDLTDWVLVGRKELFVAVATGYDQVAGAFGFGGFRLGSRRRGPEQQLHMKMFCQ